MRILGALDAALSAYWSFPPFMSLTHTSPRSHNPPDRHRLARSGERHPLINASQLPLVSVCGSRCSRFGLPRCAWSGVRRTWVRRAWLPGEAGGSLGQACASHALLGHAYTGGTRVADGGLSWHVWGVRTRVFVCAHMMPSNRNAMTRGKRMLRHRLAITGSARVCHAQRVALCVWCACTPIRMWCACSSQHMRVRNSTTAQARAHKHTKYTPAQACASTHTHTHTHTQAHKQTTVQAL